MPPSHSSPGPDVTRRLAQEGRIPADEIKMSNLDAAAVPRVFSVVLGISDPGLSELLASRIEQHDRFHVANSAPNAIMTVDLSAHVQPDLVVMSDQSPGLQGHQVLGDLHAVSPTTVVIMTTGGDPAPLAVSEGVSHAVHDHDVAALGMALDSTVAMLEGHGGRTERRVQERRVHQDWTKVFAERRVMVRRAAPSAESSAG